MKKSLRWIVFVVAATVVAAFGYGVPSQPNLGGERWRQSQADNVREAVFRWQIARHRRYGEVCFLTIDGRSASATVAFIAEHFKDSPFVKPLAASQMRAPHTPMLYKTKTIGGFVDARTGQRALNFWTTAVRWKSDATAEVDGGGAAAIGSGNDGTFTVIWKKQRWNATRYKMRAMY